MPKNYKHITMDERRGQGTMDRRWHKRVSITGIAILKFEKRGDIQSIQAVPGNISLGGIGVYADVPIEIDTNVSITIDFISVDGIKADSIEGRVLHYKDIGNIYFIGIQFNEEINPENQPSLHKHIQKILTWDKE
jgi:c-di-GMP-binding flagellar brake protein YcgR